MVRMFDFDSDRMALLIDHVALGKGQMIFDADVAHMCWVNIHWHSTQTVHDKVMALVGDKVTKVVGTGMFPFHHMRKEGHNEPEQVHTMLLVARGTETWVARIEL